MGYSVTAPCKSAKAKAEMLAFLAEHYRSPDEFIDGIGDDGLRGPLGEDLSYSNGKCEIGFDFTSWTPARDFAISMCRWVALRVGRMRKLKVFEGNPIGIKAVISYYVYDGYEAVPIRLKSEWFDKAPEECREWSFVDEHGWAGHCAFSRVPRSMEEMMHEELKRLSQLWTTRV